MTFAIYATIVLGFEGGKEGKEEEEKGKQKMMPPS
jgi:hypothetical protein